MYNLHLSLVIPNCCLCCHHPTLTKFVILQSLGTTRMEKSVVSSVCCFILKKSKTMETTYCLSESTEISATVFLKAWKWVELKIVCRWGVYIWCMYILIKVSLKECKSLSVSVGTHKREEEKTLHWGTTLPTPQHSPWQSHDKASHVINLPCFTHFP